MEMVSALALALLCSQSPVEPQLAAPPSPAAAPSLLDQLFTSSSPIPLSLSAEVGFIALLQNDIQSGRDGTRFSFVSEGGQNTLQPFFRFSFDTVLAKKHQLTALYQPLDLVTEQVLRNDLVVNGQLFPAGTAMDFRYGFSFWRASYSYNFFGNTPGRELAVGLSMQIRNANIIFASKDGRLLRTSENIGPVPIIKLRSRYTFENKFWLGAEIDGFYASGAIITGSLDSFTGSLFDVSLRAGIELTPAIDVFGNIRILAGGASGTQSRPTAVGSDGFGENWLFTGAVSVGFTLKVPKKQ
jgi:hypothetical protein